jgi:hypothetical protein
MKRTCLLFLILAGHLSISAQENIKISTPEVSLINNILTVKYDITGCGTGDYINIRLIVLNAKGDTIKPAYVTGDIGSRVNCGFGKKIEWNVARDNVFVDEDFDIQVTGKPVVREMPAYIQPQKTLPRGNILLSSALVPGLGQKKASGKGGYLAFSGLVYGAGGASLASYLIYKNVYNDYKAASGTERDDLFTRSENLFDLSQYMLYSAVGLWAVNMIWSAAIPIKETSNMKVGLIRLPESGYLISAKWTF